MKVCFINTLYYPNVIGGAERSVQFLAEELVRRGHQVMVISLAPESGITTINHNGVTVYFVGHRLSPWPFRQGGIPWFLKPYYFVLDSFYNPLICRTAMRILKREQPDVVHTNNIFGFSPQIWRLVKKLGIPIVHTLRDYSLLCTRSTMWKNNENCQNQCFPCRIHIIPRRIASHSVDWIIGISDYLFSHHQKHELFTKIPFKTIIYNPFPSGGICTSNVTPLKHDGTLHFGFLGRLEKEKGIELLLEGFQHVSHEHKCRLLIGGEGDSVYKRNLQRKYAASPAIEFLGFVAPQKIFSKIDLLVVPSLWCEPLGRVIFESYSYGVPVIASSKGGISEIIADGETGFLFDPAHPETLVEKMRYSCSNPQRIQAMKPACLEMAKKFVPAVIADQYFDVYQQVLVRHHAGH